MEKKEPNGGAALQRWLTIGAICLGFLAPIAAGGWWLSNLNGRVNTLEEANGRLSSQIVALNDRMDRRGDEIGKLQILATSTCEQMAKIETQFGIAETIINKDNIDSMRERDRLNAKVFGMLPSGVYYEVKIPHEVMPCRH